MSSQHLRVDLLSDAVTALHQLARITGRSVDEVVSDALRTYHWILGEQARGRRIVSENDDPHETVQLANFIKDSFAASQYFAEQDFGY